jgi:hypothetical protein
MTASQFWNIGAELGDTEEVAKAMDYLEHQSKLQVQSALLE